jgi:glycosyltransferase involved in cell wall biosynthesis
MHILLVADGRSPIARRWVQGLLALQHQVSFVSTYPCEDIPGVLEQHLFPVAFAGLAGSQVKSAGPVQPNPSRQTVARFRGLFLSGRYVLGPLSLLFYAPRFRRLVNRLKPDLVHALRIPFEGMLASYTPASVPMVVTIWGNDLTLHARGSAWMRALTTRTLRRAAGLAADSHRDIRLGQQWGFYPNKPTLVVPGSGGIDLMELHRVRMERGGAESSDTLPAGVPFVINPRGFRPGSVRNDVFFQSIPLVLDRKPNVHFVCTAMAGQSEALSWIQRLKIGSRVRLLPYVSQAQLWDLFLRSEISVSISEHDGTPNSLLEAMACGCFPIAGDIESIREWITPGINGLLVEPSKPQMLAESILLALDQPALRTSAAEANLKIIQQHAEVNLVRSQIQVFYKRLIQ